MTMRIRLSRLMRRDLAAAAARRLMQSLDAISHAPPGPPAGDPDLGRLATLPFAQIPPRLSRDAYWVLTRDPGAGRDPVWNDVCRRADALRAELRSRHLPAVAA